MFDAYLLTPAAHFRPVVLEYSTGQPETINELLDLNLPDSKRKISLLDFIEEKYYQQRKRIRSKARKTGDIPSDWTDSITIKDPRTGTELIIVEFGGSWDFYKARLEGYLLNGSYSFTELEFKGEQSFPSIDERGPNPGRGWKKIDSIPEKVDKKALIGVLYGGAVSFRKSLRNFGNLKIVKG